MTPIKILHCGDIHVSGKNFNRIKEALKQVAKKAIDEKVNVIVISGDIFDRYNIADRYKTVGEQQKLFLLFINTLFKQVDKIIIVVGNHDTIGEGKASIEFLRGINPNLHVCDKPEFFPLDECGIGIIPWLSKRHFCSQKCEGKDKSSSDSLFSTAIHDLLGYWEKAFTKHKEEKEVPCLLFGHCDVQGTAANEYYIVQGGSFAFTKNQLCSTGADYVSLSHIHKRQGMYVGALCQTNFGEEGNPQGFEIITINNQSVEEVYYNIDIPSYITVEIETLDNLRTKYINPHIKSIRKLRFHSEKAYEEALESTDGLIGDDDIVEKLWTKRNFVARTEIPINSQMSDNELLLLYISLNPIPTSIDKQKVLEALVLN